MQPIQLRQYQVVLKSVHHGDRTITVDALDLIHARRRVEETCSGRIVAIREITGSTVAKTIPVSVVIFCSKKQIKTLETLVAAVDAQSMPATEKIVVFSGCEPPEWFAKYKKWDYTLTAVAEVKSNVICVLSAAEQIDADYIRNIIQERVNER